MTSTTITDKTHPVKCGYTLTDTQVDAKHTLYSDLSMTERPLSECTSSASGKDATRGLVSPVVEEFAKLSEDGLREQSGSRNGTNAAAASLCINTANRMSELAVDEEKEFVCAERNLPCDQLQLDSGVHKASGKVDCNSMTFEVSEHLLEKPSIAKYDESVLNLDGEGLEMSVNTGFGLDARVTERRQSDGAVTCRKPSVDKLNCAEEILPNAPSVLGNPTFSLTQNIDRLRNNDTRRSVLRKHLPLTISSSCSSVMDCTSPSNRHNELKWSHGNVANGISVLKSPTLSMADIAVVVPTSMAHVTPEENLHEDCNFDFLTETQKHRSASAESLALSDNSIDSEMSPSRNLAAAEVNGVHCNKSKIENSTSKARRSKKRIVRSNIASSCSDPKNEKPCLNVDTKSADNFTSNDASTYCDERIEQELVSNGIDESALRQSIRESKSPLNGPVAHDSATDKNSVAFHSENNRKAVGQEVISSENSQENKDVDNQVLAYNGVIDAEIYDDSSEWQFVKSGRNKQKRRHPSASKNSSHSMVSQSRSGRSTVNSQRKNFDVDRKSAYPRHYTQSTKPRTSSAQVSGFRQKSHQRPLDVVKLHTPLTSNIKYTSCKTDVSLTSVENAGYHSSKTDVYIESKNEVTPVAAESQQRNSQLSSESKKVNQSMPQANNIITDPNCVVMNGDDRSSSEGATNAAYLPPDDLKADDGGNAKPHNQSEKSNENSIVNPYITQPIGAKLDPEELIKQLVRQFEYYFSSENLNQDPFLVSQMDVNHYVPIDVIANFNAIKKLTLDINLVKEALKASPFIELDEAEENVRANKKKCTLIVRDIDINTPPEDVIGLFDAPGCPKVMLCDIAGPDHWYVTFANDTDAYTASYHLRENVKEFRGKAITSRFKLKTHHLNTYSCHAVSGNGRVAKDKPVSSAPSVPQQVTSPPVDYTSQPLFFCQPQFTTAHPATHMAHPPFIARVAAPTTGAGSGPVPSSAMAVSNPFNGGFQVVPSWPTASFYPGSDIPVMAPHLPGQFMPTTGNYKQTQVGNLHQPPVTGNSKHSSYSGGHRNSYNQRKSSSGSYPPQQTNNGTIQRYVVSSDPNPPAVMPDMIGQFVHSESSSAQAAHPASGARHYLPAVNAVRTPAPFVTPTANESGFVLLQSQPPHHPVTVLSGVSPHVAPQRRGQTPSVHNSQRPSTSGNPVTHQQNTTTSSNNMRVRYSNNSRSSNNSYSTEISPRFIAKGVNSAYQAGAFGYPQNPSYPSHKSGPPSGNSNQDYHMMYPNRAMNGMYQNYAPNRTRNSPPSDEKEYSGDGNRPHSAMNHRGNAGPIPSNNMPMGHDQRNAYQSGGMEQRRNSRHRRMRRNEEERNSHTSPPPLSIGNTSFTLESNSFPPLPGAPDANAAPSTHHPAGEPVRPAAADVVKGLESVKISPPESNQSSVPLKKYSEVSSASSHGNKNPIQQQQQKPVVAAEPPLQASKAKADNKPKPSSAVNTQPIADKNPPTHNKRPHSKQGAPEKLQVNSDSSKSETANRSNNAASSSKKPAAASNAHKETKKSIESHKNEASGSKNEAASKSDKSVNASSKNSADPKMPSPEVKEVPKDGSTSDDLDSTNADLNGRKPTYAEMLKVQKDAAAAAAAAAQMNGATSESGKSESGDDCRSGDEVRDTEPKSSIEQKPETKASKRVENDNEPVDKRDMVSNGNHRRGDYEHKRPWNRYRDRNDGHNDYRGNRSRDWYDRGHRDNRGRGFRGRRGGYRDHRYYNNGGIRVPNGQVPHER